MPDPSRIAAWAMLALYTLTPGPRATAMRPAPPTTGLMAWFDAEDRSTLALANGTVRAWRSKAGATAAVAEGPACPRYVPRSGARRAAVRFDGMTTVLRSVAAGRASGAWTLAALVAPRSNPRVFGAICSACPDGGSDYDPGFTVDLFGSGQQFDQLNVEGAGRLAGAMDQMTDAFAYGGMHAVVVARTPASIRVWIDGREQDARPANPAVTRMDHLRIGARCYDGRVSGFFSGDVAEILLYDHALDDTERTLLAERLHVTDRERAMGERDLKEHARKRMAAPVATRRWANIDAFAASRRLSGLPLASVSEVQQLPVRTDVGEAIRLGMQTMNSMFDHDRDDEPYFYSNCRADGTGELHHSVNIGIPHVVGRALWATMIGERATGHPFPPDGLRILERYLRVSFDNPDHLNSYVDPARGGARFVEFHNLREGLYGLVALLQGRGSAWARATADAMLATLDALTDASGHWTVELARQRGMEARCEGLSPMNAGRLVDPLLAYHRLTANPTAMKLAGLYARAALTAGFDAAGRYRPMETSSGHIHSITSSLSGITEYAILTHDEAMLAACVRAVDNGTPQYFSSWGWGDEVMPEHPANEISRGEMNQTGDIIRTALLLGDAVNPRYFDLAERFLRSMVLPTQHREPELRRFLRNASAPRGDAERNVLERTVGGYAMQTPNDRMQPGDWPLSTIDITSGTVHAMAECLLHAVRDDGETAHLNVLVTREAGAIAVQSGLPLRGEIDFRLKADRAVAIRLPAWVNQLTPVLTVDGRRTPFTRESGYLRIPRLPAGAHGSLRFRITCKEEQETVDGVQYTTTWVGNQLIEIAPRGAVSPLPF